MFLKIWLGPEMEGENLGENTLFVSSNSKLSYNDICNFLEDTSLNISKVYLGAGRQDFLGFTNTESFSRFYRYCINYAINVTIETTPENLTNLSEYLDFCEIILSIRNSKIPVSSNIKLKIDDYTTARIFSNDLYFDTDLSNVSQDRYSCDKVLLDKES